MITTLPTDSNERKGIPIISGVLRYFPAAIAGVARHSLMGNDKHNPGQVLYHARGKSGDHADCIGRHLMDLGDFQACFDRLGKAPVGGLDRAFAATVLLWEANAMSWRTLALSQELHEKFGAPLAPAARLPSVQLLEKSTPKQAPGSPAIPASYRESVARIAKQIAESAPVSEVERIRQKLNLMPIKTLDKRESDR